MLAETFLMRLSRQGSQIEGEVKMTVESQPFLWAEVHAHMCIKDVSIAVK